MDLQELIKAALKKKGLPEDLHDKIKIDGEDPEKVDEAVEAFAETYTPPKKTFAEFVKESGYEEDLNKLIQSTTDKRVTQALETFQKKLNLGTPKKSGSEDDDLKYNELLEKINTLSETLTGQAAEQKKLLLKDKIAAKLDELKLPKEWVSRVNVTEESEIESVVKTLEDEFTTIKQGIIDAAIDDDSQPGFGVKDGSTAKTQIKAFADSLKKEDKQMKVQKLE